MILAMDDAIDELRTEEFMTDKEKNIVKKGLLVLLFPFFLVFLTGKTMVLVIKRILWNKVTKWCLRKILFFPFKLLQFLGKEIDAFVTFFD